MESKEFVRQLHPGIFQIRGFNGSSHTYALKGMHMNVLIDSGAEYGFPVLERGLFQIGLRISDIDLVINTHEHSDHIGANWHFQKHSLIAAHRLAATKMVLGDFYVTMQSENHGGENPMRVHLWLEDMNRIDLGNYTLRIAHAPGHTSGSISIYEENWGVLFSADSIFAGGVLSYIAESGSIGDYVDSLRRLRSYELRALYPGHGRISRAPVEDIDRAIENAHALLDPKCRDQIQLFYHRIGVPPQDNGRPGNRNRPMPLVDGIGSCISRNS